MDGPPLIFDEKKEAFVEKWTRRAKQNPFLAGGLVGMGGALIAAIRYRRALQNTGMSTSVFLTQVRVIAQGMVVGALSIGLFSQMIKDFTSEPSEKK